MKSARSSKKPFKFLFLIPALLFPGSGAVAQDNGYVPPPMFEDLGTPMVRPQSDTGNLVEPKASPNTQLPPETPNVKSAIPPRVSSSPDSGRSTTTTRVPPRPVQPVAKPVPPAAASVQKMQPIIDPRDKKKPATTAKTKAPAAPVVKPAAKPATEKPEAAPPSQPETAIAPAKPAAPKAAKIEPVKRDPKESAIQGPKTMPALPTEQVHTQETFQSEQQDDAPEQTILERSQKAAAQEAKKEAPIPPAPKKNVAPASFDEGEQGVLKRTIPFAQGQIGLSSAEIDPVAVAVSQELDAAGKEAWRVQIKAYASAYGTGVSSDKRISLSRALSLRTALIAQGIPAARIDVLAEGTQSAEGGSADRIDLYLYGPATE